MAVYKKTYQPYEGALTPGWSRFLIIPRYAFEEMRRSRFLALFALGSLVYPLICAFIIYLSHNLGAIQAVGLDAPRFLSIHVVFLSLLGFQNMLALFLAFFVGPGLVSPDLANNAVPLYLSRPFSRAEYVLGKGSVLLILMSLMTWVPGLLLFAFQSYYEGFGWMKANGRLASAMFLGSWVWILLLTLLSLAISAWVKWKPVAAALLFGTVFVSGGIAAMINATLSTHWGHIINITHLVGSVWVGLLGEPLRRGGGTVFFRVERAEEIPLWCCWASLAAICVFCLLLLSKKVKGVEVAR
jgi:ABC-2 type transport system permease protein